MQAHPMIPVLKAIIAHIRRDPVWAETRAPLMPLPEAERRTIVPQLVAEMGLEAVA